MYFVNDHPFIARRYVELHLKFRSSYSQNAKYTSYSWKATKSPVNYNESMKSYSFQRCPGIPTKVMTIDHRLLLRSRYTSSAMTLHRVCFRASFKHKKSHRARELAHQACAYAHKWDKRAYFQWARLLPLIALTSIQRSGYIRDSRVR